MTSDILQQRRVKTYNRGDCQIYHQIIVCLNGNRINVRTLQIFCLDDKNKAGPRRPSTATGTSGSLCTKNVPIIL